MYLAIPIPLLIHPSPTLDSDLFENLLEPILLPIIPNKVIKKESKKKKKKTICLVNFKNPLKHLTLITGKNDFINSNMTNSCIQRYPSSIS